MLTNQTTSSDDAKIFLLHALHYFARFVSVLAAEVLFFGPCSSACWDFGTDEQEWRFRLPWYSPSTSPSTGGINVLNAIYRVNIHPVVVLLRSTRCSGQFCATIVVGGVWCCVKHNKSAKDAARQLCSCLTGTNKASETHPDFVC